MIRTLALLATIALLAGCQSNTRYSAEWDDQSRGDTNAWLLRTYFDTQTKNAVVRQHTLYGHHFVDNTDQLTPRGRRDVSILAEQFGRNGGGVLSLHRGDATPELYQRRVEYVRQRLAAAGADPSLVTIHDGTWAGEGTPSTRAGADYAAPSDEMPFTFHGGTN